MSAQQAWLQRMTASKIAAVVGLSPYESRFSLWHRMAGDIAAQESTPTLLRGHYLEDGIRRWLFDQHPDWTPYEATPDLVVALPDGRTHPLWLDKDNPRFGCSPDGWVSPDTLVEIKTASDSSEWGAPGTDAIPAGYNCQVQWQMMVTGATTTYVGVLSAYLNLVEYVVPYKPAYAAWLRKEADDFLASLPTGIKPQRPDLDASTATYEAVRALNPLIDMDREVNVEHDVWQEWRQACDAYVTAQERKNLATSRLLDVMGDARKALVNGTPVARRQNARGGTVALYNIKEQAA